MSYVFTSVIPFGPDKAELATVGFTVYKQSDGSVYQARTTSGVMALSLGVYQAAITGQDATAYNVVWDTGETAPVVGVEKMFPPAVVQVGSVAADVTAPASWFANQPAVALSTQDEALLTQLRTMVAQIGTTGNYQFVANALILAPTSTGSGSGPTASAIAAAVGALIVEAGNGSTLADVTLLMAIRGIFDEAINNFVKNSDGSISVRDYLNSKDRVKGTVGSDGSRTITARDLS